MKQLELLEIRKDYISVVDLVGVISESKHK